MAYVKTCVGVLLAAAACTGAELIQMDKSKIGKPAQLFGAPLSPLKAQAIGLDGASRPLDEAAAKSFAEQCAGYPSVGVSPGSSLQWELPATTIGERYLCFLVRTGHQRGYEYVHPEMTYWARLDDMEIQMEPVYEVRAVRVYQSKDSWGHDMSWVRSKRQVQVKPGQRLTIGCKERYAFVSLALLVSPDANRVTETLGKVNRIERRLDDLRLLANRVAETFPAAKAVLGDADRALKPIEGDREALTRDIEAATEAMRDGRVASATALVDKAHKLLVAFERAETAFHQGLLAVLRRIRSTMLERLRPLQSIDAGDYYGRECLYAAGVAARYLAAAGKQSPGLDTVERARRLATHLWRASQFLARADEARTRASAHARPGEARQTVSPKSAVRGRVLLNGVWDIAATGGTLATPPQDGWQPIRVPHGPWHETVGQFMALGRKWPRGKHWAWYRLRFPVPGSWAGSRLMLRFDAVFHLCEAYVNGRFVGRHIGGFDPFKFDISGLVTPGQTAELLCLVHDTTYTALDKSPRKDQPKGWSSGPNHYVISDAWGARFGGIWQDVSLVAEPPVSVQGVRIMPSYRLKTLKVCTTIDRGGWQGALTMRQDVLMDGQAVQAFASQRLDPAQDAVEQSVQWATPKHWGIGGEYGDPANLYFLRTRLFAEGQSAPVDTHCERFGFREFWIENGQFHLNGKRLPLQGGGTWYLQESKIPHGHRWFGLRFFPLERGMNVNIERWHRHGDVASEFFDLADELGMLNEPEGAYWGCYGVPDILGYATFDDPVWVENVTRHYQAWVHKHFNHPSIVLWSIENETFTRAQRPPGMLDRFLAFGDAVNAVDPTRPVTYHGSENGRHATRNTRIQIVNLHYPSNDKTADWREKWGGRPCIDGEFQTYPPLFHMSHKDRQVAQEHMGKLQQWIEAKWAHYRQVELAGSFYFLPYMAGLFSTARPEWMGPWGNLLPPLKDATVVESGWAKGRARVSAWAPITWPSLSGPGIKCERLRVGPGNVSHINWFDPARPVATPTPVYETIKKSWRPMPALRQQTAPELIVTVRRGETPVAGAAAIATPLDGQCCPELGVMTDPAGTAWFVFREPGRYRVSCSGASVEFTTAYGRLDTRPGFAHVPRVGLSLE